MAFLRTLFWVVVAVVAAIFSLRNWQPVTINLFGDLRADVKLPVLLLIAFLLGFVPAYVWQRALRWRDRRRAAAPPVVVHAPEPAPAPIIETVDPAAVAPARAD